MFKFVTAVAVSLAILSAAAHAGSRTDDPTLANISSEPVSAPSASLADRTAAGAESGLDARLRKGEMADYRLINDELCEVKIHQGNVMKPRLVYYLELDDAGFENCRERAAGPILLPTANHAGLAVGSGIGGATITMLVITKATEDGGGPREVPVSP